MKLDFLKRSAMFFVCLFVVGIIPAKMHAQSANTSTVNVKIVTDEADAALAITSKKLSGETITQADWQKLFESEGYTRLKKREAAFKHSFTDDEFKTFVLSNSLLSKQDEIALTLAKWKKADILASAQKSLQYLPTGAKIKATIYPMIKPRKNSFVFETGTDPAIFIYIDPSTSKAEFENTLAHELHHIGYASSCEGERKAEIAKLPKETQKVVEWVGAFGEGFAMLAAAGGPNTHPHQYSSSEDRNRWDKDVANFNDNLKAVDSFFASILNNSLDEKAIDSVGFDFMGVQGPWYTVGWKMAVVIEKTLGKQRLIDCICDQRLLLSTYNEAAILYNNTRNEHLATWSEKVIKPINN